MRGVRDSDTVAAMRRELGRQLAVRRKAAGLVQRELGRLAGYSRTAIANADICQATATTSDGAGLTLSGGVRAVPALSSGQTRCPLFSIAGKG
jgi:hypothetical protein